MTIKDIAKECGCAIGTVSRVLNNHPDVSEKTRQKVMAVVEKHGFVLNTNAKQLKTQDRKNIVIIVKGASSTLLNGLLEKIQKKLEILPYTANVVVLDENDNEGMVATRINFEQKPLGFIFLGGNPKKLRGDFEKVHIPSVLISNQAESLGSAYISSVSIDNMKASFTSAEFLLKNGHRKIGVIGGALDSEISSTRYEGFLSALISAGVHFDFDHSYEIAKYSFEGGALAAKRLIEKNPDITAVFTMSDAMAIGACRAFRDLGYKVPENISVIGFDGLAISDYLCPRLTTIRQIEEELACEGLNVLLDSIENKAPCCHKIVPFEFIEGESVKKID